MSIIPSKTARDAVRRVFENLDGTAVGDDHCDYGGASWWAERSAGIEAAGLEWAGALQGRLAEGGRSLYVGAGVAELAPILTEVLDLRRHVSVRSLRLGEVEAIRAALDSTGVLGDRAGSLDWEGEDVRVWVGDDSKDPVDQIVCVSVFTDTDTWPNVSGVTYGRLPAVQIDVEAFVAEREDVCGLVDAIGEQLAMGGQLCTSIEEAAWWLDWAERSGREVEADDTLVETAVVGDPIGWLRIG